VETVNCIAAFEIGAILDNTAILPARSTAQVVDNKGIGDT
jgi:hypothetical protein